MSEFIDYSSKFNKYNLGCGTLIYKDFLNIGYWNNLEINGLYKDLNGTTDTYMLNMDLRNGIPAGDGSLDLIYHAHMLEHLTYQDGIKFIQDCFRTLKSGGNMRMIVPDLEIWVNGYYNNNSFFFKEYQKILDKKIYVTIKIKYKKNTKYYCYSI